MLTAQLCADPKKSMEVYNTKETCPLAGCSNLLDNTYDQGSMGPHDRLADGVAGWTSSIRALGPKGTKVRHALACGALFIASGIRPQAIPLLACERAPAHFV